MSSLFQNKTNIKTIIGWVISICIPLILFLIPCTESYNYEIKMFFVITVFFILCMVFDNLNTAYIGILMPVCYVVFAVCKPAVAFQSWSNHVVWMALGSFMFADMMMKSGFAKRLVYKMLSYTGGSYRGILIGVGIAGIILSLVMSGRVQYILAPLCYSLILALGLERSKAAVGILLTSASICCDANSFLYSNVVANLEEVGASVSGGASLPWIGYITNNVPMIFYAFLIIWLYSIMFKPEEPIKGKDYFREEYAKLGRMDSGEFKTLTICLILLVSLLSFGHLHRIQIGWCFILCGCLFFAPGINVGDKEDLKKLNYGFVIFIASCFTIGNVTSELGLGQICADLLLPLVDGKSAVFTLMVMWVFTIILNAVMTPVAIIAAMTIPFTVVVMSLGINPDALYLIMLSGFNLLLFPYESGNYLLHYSYGCMTMKDFMKGMYIKMAITAVFLIVVLIPYWKLVGFLFI